MSEVASLELSKDLFELTGWDDTVLVYSEEFEDIDEVNEYRLRENIGIFPNPIVPAYDLGFLIRKFPPRIMLIKTETNYMAVHALNGANGTADTPENACAKLLIYLIKEKVIKI